MQPAAAGVSGIYKRQQQMKGNFFFFDGFWLGQMRKMLERVLLFQMPKER